MAADEIALKVDVLMKEYGALRAEVVARIQGRLQLLGFVVAGAALVLGQDVRAAIKVAYLLVGLGIPASAGELDRAGST